MTATMNGAHAQPTRGAQNHVDFKQAAPILARLSKHLGGEPAVCALIGLTSTQPSRWRERGWLHKTHLLALQLAEREMLSDEENPPPKPFDFAALRVAVKDVLQATDVDAPTYAAILSIYQTVKAASER